MKKQFFLRIFLLVLALINFQLAVLYSESLILEIDRFQDSANLLTEKILKEIKLARVQKKFSFPRKKLSLLSDIKANLIEEKKDFIEADLELMKLTYWKEGETLKEYPILVKGKEQNWGETASGFFNIKRMSRLAFSNLGDVYMPYWMEFWGNYSVHGQPYNPDGTLAQSIFSSGCINLKTSDAKDLYGFAEIGTPIFVSEKDFQNDSFDYSFFESVPDIPEISSTAYLVADLKNNFVFLEKDSEKILPIASVTKLMTSLVAAENYLLSFNKDKTTKITINSEMLKPIGQTPGIETGKKYTYLELLYPALMFSSNDAAEALAVWYGKEKFFGLMEKRAESLGMTQTHFVDSFGYDPENVSTAEDLFYLARYLLNNRSWILEITKGKVFHDFGELKLTGLKNFNIFENDPDFIGGKTGATPAAKKTGVFLFNLDVRGTKRPFAIIILGSEDNEKDAKEILNWIKELLSQESSSAS